MKQRFIKSLLLCILAMAGQRAAAYDCVVDGICYNLKGDEAEVTRWGSSYRDTNEYAGDIVIPSSITAPDGKVYKVTKIGWQAFKNSQLLNSVVIPESVVSIEYGAFYDCRNLKSCSLNSVC